LTRAQLLEAANEAAAAYAAGVAQAEPNPAAGRPFEITLAFGCEGPRPEPGKPLADGLAHAALAPNGKDIVLRLTPADWSAFPPIAAAIGEGAWEAAEGYWIPRPWLMTSDCPVVPRRDDAALAPAADRQVVGLAAVFEPGGSRFLRRNGRAYNFTVRADGEASAAPPKAGYHLVLTGRIAAFPDGATIRCHADGPDTRPVCIAAVQLDAVVFRNGDDGAQISEWRRD
jgi:hypothetical protein